MRMFLSVICFMPALAFGTVAQEKLENRSLVCGTKRSLYASDITHFDFVIRASFETAINSIYCAAQPKWDGGEPERVGASVELFRNVAANGSGKLGLEASLGSIAPYRTNEGNAFCSSDRIFVSWSNDKSFLVFPLDNPVYAYGSNLENGAFFFLACSLSEY